MRWLAASLALLALACAGWAVAAPTAGGLPGGLPGGLQRGAMPPFDAIGAVPSIEAAPPVDDIAGGPAHRRAGLVDIHRYGPGIALDIRYATRRNVTGRPLDGYCRAWALLLDPVARDLARVQRRLRRGGLGLSIFDGYRPASGSRSLVRWARRTGRDELVGTYIATRSNHNLGSAVDLTLVRMRDGRRLPMGTGYDDLSARANTLNARGRILRNRLTLVRAMERFRFTNYRREWWHFDHRTRGPRHLDIPLGCPR